MSLQTSNRHSRSRLLSNAFAGICLLSTISCIAALLLLLWQVFSDGIDWLTWDFIRNLPSRFPAKAGIRSALAGSLWLLGLTAVISVPIGIGAAIYLEEYANKNRWRTLVQTNIANLAGVPSIVYGILGLGLFVRFMALERSILAGALTLSLVVLPIIILASQEALRAVPPSIRSASFALGATKWQTVWHQVLPASIPGIMTGVILAIARALGEAAPLLAIGAVAYVPFVPSRLSDEFTALPIQIFNWSARPQEDFHSVAAAGIIVLLGVLICLNAIAVFVRYRASKRIRW